jgi:hypothetical protein
MPDCCAITAFAEYYAKEMEKIVGKLTAIPASFADIWSDVTDIAEADIEEELLVGMLQAAGDLGADDVILDLVKQGMSEIVDPAVFPIIEDAISEVRSVQAAIKVSVSLVFIAYSDSVFHLARLLALKIIAEAANKKQTVVRLKGLAEAIGASLAVLEAGDFDSEELFQKIKDASSSVQLAISEVSQMSYMADAGREARKTHADSAVGHIDAALTLLIPPVPPAPSAEGAKAALAMTGIAASGAYLNELKSTITQYQDSSNRLNALIASFKAALSDNKKMNLVEFQQSMLDKVRTALEKTYGSMRTVSGGTDLLSVGGSALVWVRDLNIAKLMIGKLPPEVREQEGLNETMLAYYDESVAMLSSISGTNITAGLNIMAVPVGALNRMHVVAGKMIQQIATTKLSKIVEYVSVESGTEEEVAAGESLGSIAQVQFSPEPGLVLFYGQLGVLGGSQPSLLEESEIHIDLVIKSMDHYLTAPQPESTWVITALMGLLELLGMDSASDMLEELNIDSFMDSSPLGWTYIGTAIECLEEAMEAAIDQGLGDIVRELDALLLPMWGEFNAFEMRMKKTSAFSVKNLLKNLEDSIAEIEKAKATVEDIVNNLEMDC